MVSFSELATVNLEAYIMITDTIKDIFTDDDELKSFLFTLGCYVGEHITVISILTGNYIVSIKDARYSIDTELAQAIII